MKRPLVAMAIAAAALAMPASHAIAQSATRPIGIAAGFSIPLSDAIDDKDSGLKVESKLGYNLLATIGFAPPAFPLGLRLDVGYTRLGSDDAVITIFEPGLATISAELGVLSGTLNAVLQPTMMLATVKPYFIGGLGFYQVKQDRELTFPDFGGFGPDNIKANDTATDIGFNVGAGLRFGIGGRAAFLEARYHRVMNDRTCGENENCASRESTAFVPLSLGFVF